MGWDAERGVMFFCRNEISWWDFMFFWPSWDFFRDHMLFAAEFSFDICLRDFLLCYRCGEMSAVVRCPHEICHILLHTFLMRYPDEMSCFWAVRRCPREIAWFLLHDFRARYPDDMACLFGPLRALRMRCHACSAVMRCLDEMSCFLAAEFSI